MFNELFRRYRITPERYSEHLVVDPEIDDNLDTVTSLFRPLSTEATDLRMGVASFCKAFPWHFVVDRQLELVQLGVGFMRIFGHHLNRFGREISTYFAFTRPRGVTLTFHEILKHANTPFVLTLQRPQGVDKYPAEVFECIFHSYIPMGIETIVITDVFRISNIYQCTRSKIDTLTRL